MTTRPVLVYGATGTQGGPVADQLLAAGRPVRVVTRDAKRARSFADRGAEVAVADLGDPESLREAHHGVDRVVLHLPLQYDFALHEKYGRNAIDAARDAGVSMLVFNTSAQVLDDPAVTVYRVRQQMVDYLLASGVPAVVLQPTFYMDNFLGPWIKPGIIDSGVLAFALPADLPMSWISAQEAAAYAVDALDRPELAGKVFDIGGPEALTGADLAARFTDALGRPVTYVGIEPDAYEQALLPLFGPAVAYEVAQQVRCIIGRGDGTVDMTHPSKHLKVTPLPLPHWISQQDWT
jgi:NAD(P)H dehydrogenase (quinone)